MTPARSMSISIIGAGDDTGHIDHGIDNKLIFAVRGTDRLANAEVATDNPGNQTSVSRGARSFYVQLIPV